MKKQIRNVVYDISDEELHELHKLSQQMVDLLLQCTRVDCYRCDYRNKRLCPKIEKIVDDYDGVIDNFYDDTDDYYYD